MGIDSIKQVEILGAMHEEYPQIRLDAESVGENLGELRTLAQISAYIEQIVAPNQPQLAIAQAVSQPETAIVQIDSQKSDLQSKIQNPLAKRHEVLSKIEDDLPVEQGYLVEETEAIAVQSNPAPSETTQRLLEIVSEKTGYPVEMLDLNLDLEADMGIDSIKQVEILGAMHEEYPQISLDVENVGENLAELKTLAQISSYIEQLLAPTPALTNLSLSYWGALLYRHPNQNGLAR